MKNVESIICKGKVPLSREDYKMIKDCEVIVNRTNNAYFFNGFTKEIRSPIGDYAVPLNVCDKCVESLESLLKKWWERN